MTISSQQPMLDSSLVDDSRSNLEDEISDQVPTLALHELSLKNGSVSVSSNTVVTNSVEAELHELPQPSDRDDILANGDVGSPASKTKGGGKGSSPSYANKSFGFGHRNQDISFQKVGLYALLLLSFDSLLYIRPAS